ncbi:MAG: DsbE family thiol:disulfide interchange protein [Chromatiales bacterium]|nr:DsbE family thiol:disulfide interchange protein [Chromatiales bacterium]
MDKTLAGAAEPAAPRRLWPFLVPIAIFAGIGVLLYLGLFRDPSLVPSPLIGKPVPEFALGPVQGRTLGLSSEDLREEVTLVNVFASWCVACRDEHPLFLALEREGVVPIHGLNYKDAPPDAAAWLDALGDPYTRIGADLDGRVGLDWGVYGVPETFVVDGNGRIAYKHIGPVTPRVLDEIILPLVRGLRAGA